MGGRGIETTRERQAGAREKTRQLEPLAHQSMSKVRRRLRELPHRTKVAEMSFWLNQRVVVTGGNGFFGILCCRQVALCWMSVRVCTAEP